MYFIYSVFMYQLSTSSTCIDNHAFPRDDNHALPRNIVPSWLMHAGPFQFRMNDPRMRKHTNGPKQS